jgi:arylsulfatase A-like enzyme
MYVATNDIHVPRFPNARFRGKSNMGLRGDAIAQFDWTVGEVMKTLKKLKLEDNTVVILSSDNGPVVNDGYKDQAAELLNGHSPAGPLRGNKYSAFEGGTRVPFIVRWPGHVAAGTTSDALVSQIDMFASCADMLNARLPEGAAVDSNNAWDALIGKDRVGREWIVQQALNHTLSLRTKDWKYIEPCDSKVKVYQPENVETGNLSEPQLYKVSEDIHENNNVAKENMDVLFKMQTLMRKIKGHVK